MSLLSIIWHRIWHVEWNQIPDTRSGMLYSKSTTCPNSVEIIIEIRVINYLTPQLPCCILRVQQAQYWVNYYRYKSAIKYLLPHLTGYILIVQQAQRWGNNYRDESAINYLTCCISEVQQVQYWETHCRHGSSITYRRNHIWQRVQHCGNHKKEECYQLFDTTSDMVYFKRTTGPVLSKPLQRLECYQLSDNIHCVLYLKSITGPVLS